MTYTGEPRIFIDVWRPIGDEQMARTRIEISLLEWMQARYPGALAVSAINQALAELEWKPQ